MKNILYLLTVTYFGLAGCKKNDLSSRHDPEASFNIATAYSDNVTAEPAIVSVYTGLRTLNTSINADSYLWDFGNGETSTDKIALGEYKKSGTYTLTLTATTKDGRKSVAKRTIRVLDYVLKQIVVTSLTARSALGWSSTYPTTGKLNLWVEILKRDAPNQEYPRSNYGFPMAPLVYKSAVVTDVDASKIPLSFKVTDKLALDMLIFNSSLGYIFNLYGQDNTGTYLISSNYGSGIATSMWGKIDQNRFEISFGFEGSNLNFIGAFE